MSGRSRLFSVAGWLGAVWKATPTILLDPPLYCSVHALGNVHDVSGKTSKRSRCMKQAERKLQIKAGEVWLRLQVALPYQRQSRCYL